MAASAFDELKKLGEVISDANRRKKFAADPSKALADEGINPAGIPAGVLNTLSGLSAEELRLLADVNASLSAAKVPHEVRSEIV